MTTEREDINVAPAGSACGGTKFGFVMGLVAGGVVGVGVGMLFAPRAMQDLRKRVTASARRLGHDASEVYHEAGTRLGDAAHDVARKGQDLRNDLSDAVLHGAQDVERLARNAHSGH